METGKERLEAIFAAALELTSTAQREVYLARVCGEDRALRVEVQALLEAYEKAGRFLVPENDPLEPGSVSEPELPTAMFPVTERAGDRIGRYRLLEKIGEGGCGVVYVAEQKEPVRRRVALKVIKLGMDTQNVIARFEAERQALAMMDHPNIAKVFDAGATETGGPYFVMELVRGIRITDYCDQCNLPTRERLDLFIQVCHAIQHAHQKGIIHRDIKPSNILVTLHDGVPVPKVIDFGIAKATEGRLTDATLYTQLHQFIGTPAYMSPEQAEMSGLEMDTRSDIYSLGVLLYELLTGRTPFDANELMAQGIDAMRQTIREREPVRPSTRVAGLKGEERTTTAKRRSAEAPKLITLLRGDLDWIAMKCLEKDRRRRYETANGLALDIERHLKHEPILARPPSTVYWVRKFARRNKLMVSAGGAVAVALVLGVAVSSWQAIRATRAEMKAEAALDEALQARDSEAQQRRSAQQAQRLAEALRFQSIAEERAVKQEYGDNSTALAHAIASLERGDTWARRRLALVALWKGPTHFRLPPVGEVVPAGWASFSPDGKWLATGSRGPQVLLWPSAGGHPKLLAVDDGFEVVGAGFSPRGRWLLSLQQTKSSPGSTAQQPVYQEILWDAITWQRRQVWDIADWGPHWFHPDESKLLAYSRINEAPYPGVAWWPINGGSVVPLGSPHVEPPPRLRFPPIPIAAYYPSQDGRWLVSWEGTNVYVTALEAAALGPRRWIGSHDRLVRSASLDARGDLVSSADEMELRIWSRARPGQPLLRVPSYWAPAVFDRLPHQLLARYPDAGRLAAYDLRGPVGSKPLRYLGSRNAPDDPSTAPSHHWVALGESHLYGAGANVWLYPVRGVWPFHVELGLGPSPLHNIGRVAPSGRWVIAVPAERQSQLSRVDLQSPDLTRRALFEAPEGRILMTAKFDRAEEYLLIGTHLAGAWLVPIEGGEPQLLVNAPKHTLGVAWSPSGQRLAVGGGYWDMWDTPEERYTRLLDREGRLLARLEDGMGEVVTDLEFLSETELLVATEGALRWWNTESNEVRLLREGYSRIALSEGFFIAEHAKEVWRYDRATLTGRRLMEADRSGTFVTALAIAPDASCVAVGYADGSMRVQRFDEEQSHYLPGTGAAIWSLRMGPKAYWLAELSSNGHLRYWPIPRGRPLEARPLDEFLDILRAQTNLRVVTDLESPEGYREVTHEFPGWETVPGWQEWYSEAYMEDPPWKSMLDPATIQATNL